MVILLSPRQLSLVAKIIEEYIETAEPVSSKAIAQSGQFEVRSATIRNEMADLEEAGYLEQLHTSGGRVPTAKAYRLYVNSLVAHEGITISHALRRRIDEALSEVDLHDAEAINKVLARQIGQMSGALVMANVSQRPDSYKVGLYHLFQFPEFREMDRLMHLTEFFDQFDAMFDNLHRGMWSQGDTEVKIRIGAENPDDRIKDETMICARYRLPGGHEGTLTMVGPMRMDYRKNIGLMSYAAQIANRITSSVKN
jgi:heat-inducible transcriptional repressor